MDIWIGNQFAVQGWHRGLNSQTVSLICDFIEIANFYWSCCNLYGTDGYFRKLVAHALNDIKEWHGCSDFCKFLVIYDLTGE